MLAPLQQPASMASGLHLHQPSSLTLSLEPLNLLSPETTLAPLNAASEPWVRSLVWTDFRVAVALFVVLPFGLLAASVAARVPRTPDDRSPSAETVLRLMTSYWQASSLLLLTVALNVQEANFGVFAGLAAQAMIVVSLWWWSDLNRELDDAPLSRAFRAWRLPTSAAAAGGVLVQLPFQGCVGAESLAGDAFCAPWLEPPKFAAGLVGLEPSPALGAVADIGCLLYFAVLSYYATVLLPTVGRSGRAARPTLMNFTPIGAWRALGFLSEADDALAPTAPPPAVDSADSAPLDRFRTLMGTLYGVAGIAHAADCLAGPSALLTAAGAPPFRELSPPAQALAVIWCAAGPLAYLTSRRGGRAADAGLVAYGVVEVLGAALASTNVDAAELAALPNALAVQGVVAASWIYSSTQTDKS